MSIPVAFECPRNAGVTAAVVTTPSQPTTIVTGNNTASTRQVDAAPAGGHYFAKFRGIFKNRFPAGDSEMIPLKATLGPEEDAPRVIPAKDCNRARRFAGLFTTVVSISTSKVLLPVISLSYARARSVLAERKTIT